MFINMLIAVNGDSGAYSGSIGNLTAGEYDLAFIRQTDTEPATVAQGKLTVIDGKPLDESKLTDEERAHIRELEKAAEAWEAQHPDNL
jgi:hypothetical protein